ncbi:MAG: hypothetical protein NC418_08935 [Muribaculaceae bacterium]|nr:hypothetical protein [Muribaculaceae bacterium]
MTNSILRKSLFPLLLAATVSASATDFSLPFSFTPSQAAIDDGSVVIVDANGDAQSKNGLWSFETKYESSTGVYMDTYKYLYSMEKQANDWLFLPLVNFGDCTNVKVSFRIQTYTDKEDFEVCLGQAQTAEAMTTAVLSKKSYTTSNKWATLTADVTVPAAGDWCLGFHASSPAFMGWIYITDFKIEAGEEIKLVVPANPVVKSSAVAGLNYTATVAMPATDTEGAAIDGTMNLKVYVDGSLADTKTDCTAGADVPVALTLEAGEHTIGYAAVLGEQTSDLVTEKVTAEKIVITPAAPAIKSSSMEALVYSATVTMPAVDTNGKEITGKMNLKLAVDGTVTTTITDCAAGADVPVSTTLTPGEHTVAFCAVLDGEESASVEESVEATEPTFELPFTFTPSDTNKDECIIIDANGDGEKFSNNGVWTISDGAFCYTYHSRNQADDWVILPMVDFADNTAVKVSVSVKTGSYNESFELKLGTQRTVAAMTVPVMEKTNFQQTGDFAVFTAEAAVPQAGKWVLGIHATSSADQGFLYIKDIRIEAIAPSAQLPAVPAIKESAVAGLDYTATVTMPATFMSGDAIEGELSLKVYVDGEIETTIDGCAAGADVPVALPLSEGEHTISFQASTGTEDSELVSESVVAKADAIVTGALPFNFAASQENFDLCLTFDENGDKAASDPQGYNFGIWSFASANGQPAFKYAYSSDNDADDWIILPLVDFGESSEVRVSLGVATEYDTESFEVCLGRDRTPEAMTVPVLSKKNYTHRGSFETLSADVELPAEARSAAGEWCIGVHATSSKNHYNLYVNDFKIESLRVTTGVESVEVTDDAEPEYYNLQGLRIANPAPGTMVIVRKGGHTYKTIIR